LPLFVGVGYGLFVLYMIIIGSFSRWN